MTNSVKSWSHFYGLTNETNKFAFEVNTKFRLKNTVLDGVGRLAGLSDGRRSWNKPATDQLGLDWGWDWQKIRLKSSKFKKPLGLAHMVLVSPLAQWFRRGALGHFRNFGFTKIQVVGHKFQCLTISKIFFFYKQWVFHDIAKSVKLVYLGENSKIAKNYTRKNATIDPKKAH